MEQQQLYEQTFRPKAWENSGFRPLVQMPRPRPEFVELGSQRRRCDTGALDEL